MAIFYHSVTTYSALAGTHLWRVIAEIILNLNLNNWHIVNFAKGSLNPKNHMECFTYYFWALLYVSNMGLSVYNHNKTYSNQRDKIKFIIITLIGMGIFLLSDEYLPCPRMGHHCHDYLVYIEHVQFVWNFAYLVCISYKIIAHIVLKSKINSK